MRKSPRLSPEELEPFTLKTPPLGQEASAPTIALDWYEVFGNDHPVEIEVGFGKGLFLVGAGQAHPETNYLGIEIVRKYQLFTATRLAKRNLRNVKTACADARWLLRAWVGSDSVQRVHVYFPDPWWKHRHHKRRVFTSEFALECHRILKPAGELLVVTDVADYAEMVRETVAEHTAFRELPPPEENAPQHDMDYLTNFERKFRQEGKPIYRMRYTKSDSNLSP